MHQARSANAYSHGYRIYVLGLLSLIYLFSLVDRQIVTILAEAIKQDLGLADWQIGMITGLSFSLFYTTLGVPIAKLADRHHRIAIISISIGVWSLFTALCGLSRNFVQLALMRVGVGVGEAGGTPAAHSAISDYVSKERRPLALAIYALGNPLGVLVGLAVGGLVAQTWGWRVAFFVVGAPGVLLGIVTFLTIREPQRRTEDGAGGRGFISTCRALGRKPSYWFSAFGVAGTAFYGSALQTFAAPFFLRNHAQGLERMAERAAGAFNLHLEPIGLLGLALGLSWGLAGAVGVLLGGALPSAFRRRGDASLMVAPFFGSLVAAPVGVAACLTPDTGAALALWGVVGLLFSIPISAGHAVAQTLAPIGGRAMSSAILLVVINLAGTGMGPLAAGVLSDLFNAAGYGAAEGVRYSLLTVSSASLLAALLFWLCGRLINRDSLRD